MTVDPKRRGDPIPPGTPVKRVRVIRPVGFGTYGNYKLGDELDLPECDWRNHLGNFMEEVGDNPEPWPPKVAEVAKEFKSTAKKTRRRVRLANKNHKEDGDT